MKLSVITVNLNNASGLKMTVESVVSQSSTRFEYIVIDGGSMDGSVDVIKQYQDKITYWISEPDKGIYNAMNKGIKVAKGEYCQFVNSGDRLIKPDVIEKLLAQMPPCSFFYGNMLKTLPGGKIYRDRCESGRISLFTFIKGSLNHTPVLIKRDLFDKYGFYDETLKIVSDWKFYLIAIGINNEPVRYTDMDVAFFDMNGISNSEKDVVAKERDQVLKSLLPHQVLQDYYSFVEDRIIIERLKSCKPVWILLRIIFRILSRLDKLKNSV